MLIYIISYVGWIQPKIVENQPVVYGITQKMFQFILQNILNLLNTRQALRAEKYKRSWNCCAIKAFKHFKEDTNIPLISYEVNLILTWSKNCVITDETIQDANPNVNPPIPETRAPTGATSVVTDAKLYVPVVTLSTEEDNKLLEQLKTEFKRTIKLNKYRLFNWFNI